MMIDWCVSKKGAILAFPFGGTFILKWVFRDVEGRLDKSDHGKHLLFKFCLIKGVFIHVLRPKEFRVRGRFPKAQYRHDFCLKRLPVGGLKTKNLSIFRTPVRLLDKPHGLYFSVVPARLLWLASSCRNKIITSTTPAPFPGTDSQGANENTQAFVNESHVTCSISFIERETFTKIVLRRRKPSMWNIKPGIRKPGFWLLI